MRRLIVILALVAAGFAAWPSVTAADAGCDAVVGDLPILTDNIQTEWVTLNCSPDYRVRVTLSEFVDGDWQRASCPLNDTGDCTRVHPRDWEGAVCDPFYCDGSDHHLTDAWNQIGDPCAHTWRTKVTVSRLNGDVIAVDTSPGNTC